MTITLRPAMPEDSDFAYRANRAAFRVYIEQIAGWDEAAQRELHERRFSTQTYRIISTDGADVGILASEVLPDCLKLNQLFILPEHQSRGIGRQCMLLVMSEARELRLPVRLRVLHVNSRALDFYERLGFTRVGQTATHHLLECQP